MKKEKFVLSSTMGEEWVTDVATLSAGYVLQNAGCGIKKVKRDQVIRLAQQGKIGNARVQNHKGTVILRGIGCSLDELPSEIIN